MGKLKDPINNDDMVYLHRKDGGEPVRIRFGIAKSMFIRKTLKFEVSKVYLPRTNTYWFVRLDRTKGFKFEKLAS